MKLIYLSRKPAKGQISIERVFESIYKCLPDTISAQTIQVPCSTAKPPAVLKNLLFSRKIKADIVHVTGDVHYTVIVAKGKKNILTIHDLGGYFALRSRSLFARLSASLLWGYLPIRKADHITCISDFTRDQIIKEFPWAANKISVIPDPLPFGFTYTPDVNFNLQKPRLLHIGTKDNKNLLRLIEALSGFPCHLRIIGSMKKEHYDALEKYHIEFSNAFNLSDAEIIEEYKACNLLCFVSTFEGFGMPIIEAQAIGRPVVTSNLSPMCDIAKNSALLVDPYDVSSIRAGIERVITDSSFRSTLVQRGLENASRFSAPQITEQYLALYHNLLS